MLLNKNKFSDKNKKLYKSRCINLRNIEFVAEKEIDTSQKVERFK